MHAESNSGATSMLLMADACEKQRLCVHISSGSGDSADRPVLGVSVTDIAGERVSGMWQRRGQLDSLSLLAKNTGSQRNERNEMCQISPANGSDASAGILHHALPH